MQESKGRNCSIFCVMYNRTNGIERRPVNLYFAVISGQHVSWTDQCLNLHHKCSTSETCKGAVEQIPGQKHASRSQVHILKRGSSSLSKCTGSFKSNPCSFKQVRETTQFSVRWHKDTNTVFHPQQYFSNLYEEIPSLNLTINNKEWLFVHIQVYNVTHLQCTCEGHGWDRLYHFCIMVVPMDIFKITFHLKYKDDFIYSPPWYKPISYILGTPQVGGAEAELSLNLSTLDGL